VSDTLTICMSRAALVAAVDAVLHHVLRFDLAACHNLQALVAECSSPQCAADMELLRLAQNNGISIQERLVAIRSIAQYGE
jgi:hypothetical protein